MEVIFINASMILLIIVAISIIVGVLIGEFLSGSSSKVLSIILIREKCKTNNDCAWVITNCCPENAGANWECVNMNAFEEPKCADSVICPQVVKSKPKMACICMEGNCETYGA
jgi:hypothetical protein